MITRRQFGIWSGSALLAGPALASPAPWAAKDAGQAGATPAKTPFDALDPRVLWLPGSVAPEVLEGTKGRYEAFELRVANRGSGVSAIVNVQVEAHRGEERTENLMSWLNDAHPFSRRVVWPSAVDFPAGKELLVGTVHVLFSEGWDDPTRPVAADFSLRFMDDHGGVRDVAIGPIALDPKAKKS